MDGEKGGEYMKKEEKNLQDKIVKSKQYQSLDINGVNDDQVIRKDAASGYNFLKDLYDLEEHKISVMRNLYHIDVLNHRHDYYEVQYVYSGLVTQNINGKRFELKDGTVTVMNMNVYHSIEKATSQDRLFHVCLNESVLTQSFFSFLSPENRVGRYLQRSKFGEPSYDGYLVIPAGKNTEVRNLFFAMEKEFLAKSPGYRFNLKAFMAILFNKLQLQEEIDSPEWHEEDSWYIQERKLQIESYLNNHYKTATLKDLAKWVHVHPNYLSKFINNHYERSFSHLITGIRMRVACYMLVTSDLNVDAISDAVGYKNPNYFYKVFRKKYDCSPSEYRTRNRLAE